MFWISREIVNVVYSNGKLETLLENECGLKTTIVVHTNMYSKCIINV